MREPIWNSSKDDDNTRRVEGYNSSHSSSNSSNSRAKEMSKMGAQNFLVNSYFQDIVIPLI